jgi:antitoxin (DNA-binding transcriptional repressor) of toxin-antitoxin stability system
VLCYDLPYVERVSRRIPSASVQTITVTDVRTVLPLVLNSIKEGALDATPILIGRHREPMAVLISVEQFYEYCSLVRAGLADPADAGP